MNQEQENLKILMRGVISEFTDDVLLPGVNKTVKELLVNELKNYPTKIEIFEILRNYPTKADLEEHKDEIIKAIRGKMENVVQHQTVVTDVIERQGCAKQEELKILKESVT